MTDNKSETKADDAATWAELDQRLAELTDEEYARLLQCSLAMRAEVRGA
jgi:hypothetical protein